MAERARFALRSLPRKGLVEREPRPGANCWFATADGTRLGAFHVSPAFSGRSSRFTGYGGLAGLQAGLVTLALSTDRRPSYRMTPVAGA